MAVASPRRHARYETLRLRIDSEGCADSIHRFGRNHPPQDAHGMSSPTKQAGPDGSLLVTTDSIS
jgi:hypothetical protein